MNRFSIAIEDIKAGGLIRYIFLPQSKVDEIMNNQEFAADLMKAIIGEYICVEKEKGIYYRIFNGHKFYFDFAQTDQAIKEIQNDFMLHGEYEPYSTKIVEENVKEGDIAVDVGASIGYFTLLLAKQVGKIGKVFSIEPTTNQFPYLLKNITLNDYQDRVEAHNVAAWDKEENVKIQANASNVGLVPGIALDSILPEKVDFIKIDVDGSEPHVLKGLIKTIERNPQLKMVIEFYPAYIVNLGGNPDEVMDILNKYFNCNKISGDYGDRYWNLFCVKK